MSFIENLNQDEIRDGWLVKSDIKHVWNRHLEMWQEVDRICRKYKITYWAAFGTLLGAARHKGFIPWDDDFDLWMMRPEFNRFSKIIEQEFVQGGSLFEVCMNAFSIIKISHSQTTLLALKNKNKNAQGLIIDVFPLDVSLDGSKDSFFAVNGINELMGTVYNYPAIVKHLQDGGKITNEWSVIQKLRAIPGFRNKFIFLEFYAENLFDQSTTVDWIEHFPLNKSKPFQKSWFRDTVYMPFESIELPVPVDYEEILTKFYGDWHKFVVDRTGKLGFTHSADIPHREFLQKIDLDLLLGKKIDFNLSNTP